MYKRQDPSSQISGHQILAARSWLLAARAEAARAEAARAAAAKAEADAARADAPRAEAARAEAEVAEDQFWNQNVDFSLVFIRKT